MGINPHSNTVSLVFALSLLSSSHFLSTTFANPPASGEVEDESDFNYIEGSGKGPEDWGKINPEWEACGNGKLQSPIDIIDQRVQVLPNLGEIKSVYNTAPALLINRGHDIAVEWQGDAGKLVINGTDYNLLQCHWHSPSEHTFNGKRYDLELHLVHQNCHGGIAVIGILYKIGLPDPFLAQMLDHIIGFKTRKSEVIADLGSVNPRDIKFGRKRYYRYIGSLTVPPCTEGVIWTLSKKVRTASKKQIETLRDAVHDGFEENARPTQDQNGRPVYFYRPKAQRANLRLEAYMYTAAMEMKSNI